MASPYQAVTASVLHLSNERNWAAVMVKTGAVNLKLKVYMLYLK